MSKVVEKKYTEESLPDYGLFEDDLLRTESVIDKFFADETRERQENGKFADSARTAKERRNSFFRKEKYNPNNRRRYRDYIDDADIALAHIDALVVEGKFESNQCRCTVLWKTESVVVVRVENKMNGGESDIRLRKYPNGWREDFRSWEICRPSYRPVYFKYHGKNTPGMKQMANKHVRHKARLFMRDVDGSGNWKEEIAPSSHGWYKKVFSSYNICDY